LVNDIQLEQSNVSQQLSVLRERGIVETRRDGPTVFYRVKDRRTFRLLALAKEILASSLNETRGLLSELEEIHYREPRRSRKRGPGSP
jgi:ArsR family transcriptional regulator